MRTELARAACAAVVLVLSLAPGNAAAFCRTTTCKLTPPAFSPGGSCYPPEFAIECAALDPPEKVLPLFWRNHCVSYDLHADAQGNVSQQAGLTYGVAAQIAADSFAKWTEVQCPTATGQGRVSIDVRDLGPVSCDEVNYNQDQGNQHVIMFRDDGIDGMGVDAGNANTLGLTTVTFDTDTGELYDADMQLNSSVPLATGDPVPATGFDLQSIITHEAGHFLGLAHTPDSSATMYAQYTPGSASKRILSNDDTAGICSIYIPDGTRSVDPSVALSGFLPESACDFTPRHGFQSACTSPQSHGCAVAAEESAALEAPFGLAMAAIFGGIARRKRGGRARGPRQV